LLLSLKEYLQDFVLKKPCIQFTNQQELSVAMKIARRMAAMVPILDVWNSAQLSSFVD
jgi:hypothetical protein